MLGVGVFFTLSGYLITDILLGQLNARGRIKLAAFWLARARRLLPALFVMLAIVVAWVTIFGPAQPDQFRKGVVSAIFYVNNWQQIFADVSYFARFEAEGPLDHLWSLSVEEQFYIVWPFLLLLGVKLVRERPLPSGVRPRLALLTIAGALASTILMAVLYKPEPRPLADLLRHRHPRRRPPLRRRPGDGLAEPQTQPPDHAAGAQHARRDWPRRPPDHRPDDLADRRTLVLPLPRRLHGPLAGDGDGR